MVFEGVEPGSPAAQLLYHQHQGEISRFQGKARQNREISGQPGSSMQQAMPDGGQMRYTFNGGQETVHVKLTPGESETTSESTTQQESHHAEPLLAIDIVFEPELFMSGDIYSYTQTSREESTWLWEEGDPIPVDLNDPALVHETHNLPDNPIGQSFGGPIAYTVGDTFTLVTGIGMAETFAGPADFAFLSMFPVTRYGFAIETFTELKLTDNGNWFHDSSNFWSSPARTDPPDYKNTWVKVDAYYYYRRAGVPEPTWLGREGPPVTTNEQQNVRDQVSYFDTVNVVGAIGDVGGDSYEATSVGTSTDKRLVPTTQLGAAVTVGRTVSIGSVPPGPVGAGFIAKPRKPVDPSDTQPKPTIIDIYIAAENTIKTNTYPGLEESAFEIDDASFSYDIKRDLGFSIRCREFIDGGGGYIVRVAPSFQKRKKHFTAPNHDQEPTIAGPTVDSDAGRDASWKFAADKGWVDAGGAPADPSNARMGKLLADSGAIARTVTAHDVPPRTVHTAPSYSGGVAGMTKVATIEWTPPAKEREHGKATITPA